LLTSKPVNVVGGTLDALPADAKLALVTVAAGDQHLHRRGSWHPSGVDIWFQDIVQDGTNIHGLTLSKAMRGTPP
jgi:hypothetical protein